MLGLELVVLLGLAVLVGRVVSVRFGIVPPITLLAAGALLGFVPALRAVHLPPELVLLLFLPVLLYWESRLHYDIAGPAFPRHVPALLELVDPDRLLFGSDYCWTPPPVAAAHITAVDAAASPGDGVTWRSLTTVNAQRLFPRLTR